MLLLKNDPKEYLLRQEDLNCYPFRRAFLDLVEVSASVLNFEGKSEMMRLVEFVTSVLTSPNLTEGQCELVIRVLIKIGQQFLSDPYLSGQFEVLTNDYFIRILHNPSPLLNVLTC